MTPRDVDTILAELATVGERLARIEERLDGSTSHDERIRKMEQRWAMLTGLVVFVALELQIVGLVVAATR